MLNFVGMQKRLPFAPFQLVFPGGNPLTQFGAQPPDQFVSRANSPEGIKSMLESTITEDNILGTGLDATVYRRPDSSGKVLRAVKGFQSRLPKDLSQMKIIPGTSE